MCLNMTIERWYLSYSTSNTEATSTIWSSETLRAHVKSHTIWTILLNCQTKQHWYIQSHCSMTHKWIDQPSPHGGQACTARWQHLHITLQRSNSTEFSKSLDMNFDTYYIVKTPSFLYGIYYSWLPKNQIDSNFLTYFGASFLKRRRSKCRIRLKKLAPK